MPIARPEIRAAQEPLTQEEFRRAIEQGLGRAILCLQKHNPEPYKEIILEACLKDTAYVKHFSYNKSAYLNELLSAFTDALELRKQILEAFKNSIPDEEDRPKPALILEFAKAGLPNAREAIYDDFLKAAEIGLDWASGKEIVKLDSLSGLLFIAPYLGEMVDGDNKDEIPWHYVRDLSENLGKI
jgi:hypothetical protein